MKRTGWQPYRSNQAAGASPLFPPEHASEAAAREAVLEVVHQSPRCFAHDATRWTLARIRRSLPWLRITSDGSLWRVLERLGIRYKRGRQTVHSPDLAYEAKVELINLYLQRMVAEPTRYPLL